MALPTPPDDVPCSEHAIDSANGLAAAFRRILLLHFHGDLYRYRLRGEGAKWITIIDEQTDVWGIYTYLSIRMWPQLLTLAPLRYCWACNWSFSNGFADPKH